MISNKIREGRRGKPLKMPKNIEKLYKEGKCSECSVMVTRMDFGKILGKFTKVKIQYESSSTPRTRRTTQQTSPNNARLKSNENGMVLIHRNAYNQHPATDILNSKKSKVTEKPSRLNNNVATKKVYEASPRANNNILKENNRLKRTPAKKETNLYVKTVTSNLKRYGIMFLDPKKNIKNEYKSNISLLELLPSIDNSILPSEDWCIDYLPKSGEPKEDKVYDRIAAELEDLMYNEKPAVKVETKVESETKDDFPSIMDILNESSTETIQSNPVIQPSLESSDVEAMLLGKTNETSKEPTPMDVENNVINNLMDVVQMDTSQDTSGVLTDSLDNPHSPSILDEELQKGVEEHLPKGSMIEIEIDAKPIEPINPDKTEDENKNSTPEVNFSTVTHIVFKKNLNGECSKSVTCQKNLKYKFELNGKSVEFLGAPKFISSLEDLKVLLEIVNESELSSLYVLQ